MPPLRRLLAYLCHLQECVASGHSENVT